MKKKKKDRTIIVLFILTIISGGWLFPILFLYLLFRILKDSSNQQSPVSQQEKSQLSSAERQKINERLKEYFEDNDRLLITGDISLRPKSGVYKNINDLQVYQSEDCVSALKEFQSRYPDMHEKVMDLLLKFAYLDKMPTFKQEKEVVKEEVVDKKKQMTIGTYIDLINQNNIEIEHEEISNGLYQICAYLKQIELIEKNFPKSHDKLAKVTQYYLPILLDILEDYKKLDGSAKSHAEFKAMEDKLIKTIILINEALKTICTTVCQEEFMSMNANMSTLEMLLRKDGLIDEDPFAKKVNVDAK